MTEQEQQLIQAILRIDHASAPEVAMALVKGIDQTVDNRLRKMAEYVKQLSSHHPEVQEITDNLNRYLAYTIKGTTDNEYGDHSIDFTARVIALLYFHPDNEQKFSDVETIGGFAPEHADERFLFLLDGSSINDEGKPQISALLRRRGARVAFFLHLISECQADLNIDESLRVRNITKLDVSSCGLLTLPGLHRMTNLEELLFSCNDLTEIDLSDNSNLVSLDCSENLLIQLDLSHNSKIEYLNCAENQLGSIDLSMLTYLFELDCSESQLTSLDITNNLNLNYLDCSDNQLTEQNKQEVRELLPQAIIDI